MYTNKSTKYINVIVPKHLFEDCNDFEWNIHKYCTGLLNNFKQGSITCTKYNPTQLVYMYNTYLSRNRYNKNYHKSIQEYCEKELNCNYDEMGYATQKIMADLISYKSLHICRWFHTLSNGSSCIISDNANNSIFNTATQNDYIFILFICLCMIYIFMEFGNVLFLLFVMAVVLFMMIEQPMNNINNINNINKYNKPNIHYSYNYYNKNMHTPIKELLNNPQILSNLDPIILTPLSTIYTYSTYGTHGLNIINRKYYPNTLNICKQSDWNIVMKRLFTVYSNHYLVVVRLDK